MTHKEAYKILLSMKESCDKLCKARYAPYPIDCIRRDIIVEMKDCIKSAGLEAVDSQEPLSWVNEP